MRHCYSLDTENLDSIAAAFVDVLGVLRRRAITPSTVASESVTIEGEKGAEEIVEDHFLKFLLIEVLEELRGLGFPLFSLGENQQ